MKYGRQFDVHSYTTVLPATSKASEGTSDPA